MNTPSGRGRRPPTPLAERGDLETLLAETVVGEARHREALLVLRACSRGLLSAVDASVELWCARFSRCQRARARASLEEQYAAAVDAERMASRAFGASAASRLMDASNVAHKTFMAALADRCVLCGASASSTNRVFVEDSEQCAVPKCVFGHTACIRKHLVLLSDSGPQRGAEPRELQRELCAVAEFCGVEATRGAFMERASEWFKAVYADRHGSQLVWLRPHPLVRPEDTLYGALGVSEAEVRRAVAARSGEVARQAEVRRKIVASRVEQHTRQCVAELRLWLGKGLTRWRSVEDLEDLHEDIMSSVGFLGPGPTPFSKRVLCGSLQVVCNTLILLDGTLAHLERARDALDWFVRCVGCERAFDNVSSSFSPYNMHFVPPEEAEDVVLAEVMSAAATVNALCACGEGDVQVTSFSKAPSLRENPESRYKIRVALFLKEYDTRYCCTRVLSHSFLCKLKFKVLREAGVGLPPVPRDGDDLERVRDFAQRALSACFRPEAGRALSVGLSVLAEEACTFAEIRNAIVARARA